MLLEHLCSGLVKINFLFQALHSITLDVIKIQELEGSATIIMCNLEEKNSSTFFDLIEHLIVHLSYKARVEGPAEYRQMYPFVRILCGLKKQVKNKAHVEASIIEAYIVEKIRLFTSLYFDPSYKFHIEDHNLGKSTMNCGVCVKSSSYTEKDNGFYGKLFKII
ncbi:UNVERIFIED_CONTAM: hypothetical protein Sradi_2657500 [Sesamum radiatum]|uniref:DUF4218 domain-containing protein n=1 Tax=Sesamum radiatum TaxID=300843 RepID=A0AAW2S6W2_SESRA